MNKLDQEEKELLESFENDEWQSVGDPSRLAQLRSYAKATLAKDKRITLRLSSIDLDALQAKAIEEGLPYQTFISSILHKYITGKLVEPRKFVELEEWRAIEGVSWETRKPESQETKSAASKVLRDKRTGANSKSAAGSVLSQRQKNPKKK